MKTFISANKLFLLYALPIIFIITISSIGCDGLFKYPVEYSDDSDTAGDDTGGYVNEPDYPDPPDDGTGNDNAPRDSVGDHIIWIGYWKIALVHDNELQNNNSLSKTAAGDVKYYELEESYSSDFSTSNKMYKLHKDNYMPSAASTLKKYYRVRAVSANSKSEWSNAVGY